VPVGNEILAAVDKLVAQKPNCSPDHCRIERARVGRQLAERIATIERDGVDLPEGAHASPGSLAARMQVLALREFAATLREP